MSQTAGFLLEILVSSGVIWAAIMGFKRLFQEKLSPRIHLGVWLILVARLVLPVTPDAGIHFLAVTVQAPESAAHEAAATPEPASGQASAERTASAPAAAEQRSAGTGVLRPQSAALSALAPAATVGWEADPADVAVSVWILGALAAGALSLSGYEKLRQSVRRRLVAGADPLHRLFQECMAELGIKRRVVLAVQVRAAGPALLFPNIVLIPEEFRDRDPEEIRMALRHELMHFRRLDHLKAAGLSVLAAVWWFNPFVWLAVREIREDIETACDCGVVSSLGSGGRETYARTVLSMFGRTETGVTVLGMAFGGARRTAERRIRGIYLKTRSRWPVRTAAALLAGVLGVACFTTACQPTPASEAVVNQKEGVPSDALIGASETVDPRAASVPTAVYTAAEHWDETIDKADNFEVVADVDVLMPDVDAYPVERIAPRELTQEMADRLISYFAPDAEFYETRQQMTKAEWEARILSMRETLAEDEKSGDQDAVTADKITLDEWTRLYEAAPEERQQNPATTEYTYLYDEMTGERQQENGPNYIAISAESPDGSIQQFDVRRRDDSDESQWPYFAYLGASYQTEGADLQSRDMLEQSRAGLESLSEPRRSEELGRLSETQAEVNRRLQLYAQNPMELAAAEAIGRGVLNDLGITGVQIISSDRALWGPYTGFFDDEYLDGSQKDLLQPGVYLEFRRENGGIPCRQPDVQMVNPRSGEERYSAPFVPEYGSMLIDADGTVRMFDWNSPSEAMEIVAPNSELIPLSEAKERLVEELYRNELGISAEYLEDHDIVYRINDMQLVMGFASDRDHPKDALAIPAWWMQAQGESDMEGSGETVSYNVQTLMISALDGTPILMANSLG